MQESSLKLSPDGSLKLRPDGRELRRRGTPEFPCGVYQTVPGTYAGGEVPLHWHDEVELKLMLEGTATVACDGQAYQLCPGDGLFVNGGVLHHTRTGPGDCVIGSLVFEMPVLTGSPGSIFEERYFRPLYRNPRLSAVRLTAGVPWQARALGQLRRAYLAGVEGALGYELEIRAGLCRFWKELACANTAALSAPEQLPEDSTAERMRRMLSFLEAHFMEEISPADLAEAAHISERECFRCFQKVVGAPPAACILRRRVACAAMLLRETDLPVTDVGMQAGFHSPSYFSRRFRERMGCTPSEFRARWGRKTAPLPEKDDDRATGSQPPP